jgi:hypothetical protein
MTTAGLKPAAHEIGAVTALATPACDARGCIGHAVVILRPCPPILNRNMMK